MRSLPRRESVERHLSGIGRSAALLRAEVYCRRRRTGRTHFFIQPSWP